MEKTPHFSPILKWKHPSIWQLFWCDGKLPFDDYELYMQKIFHVRTEPQSGTFMTPLGFSIIFVKVVI